MRAMVSATILNVAGGEDAWRDARSPATNSASRARSFRTRRVDSHPFAQRRCRAMRATAGSGVDGDEPENIAAVAGTDDGRER